MSGYSDPKREVALTTQELRALRLAKFDAPVSVTVEHALSGDELFGLTALSRSTQVANILARIPAPPPMCEWVLYTSDMASSLQPDQSLAMIQEGNPIGDVALKAKEQFRNEVSVTIEHAVNGEKVLGPTILPMETLIADILAKLPSPPPKCDWTVCNADLATCLQPEHALDVLPECKPGGDLLLIAKEDMRKEVSVTIEHAVNGGKLFGPTVLPMETRVVDLLAKMPSPPPKSNYVLYTENMATSLRINHALALVNECMPGGDLVLKAIVEEVIVIVKVIVSGSDLVHKTPYTYSVFGPVELAGSTTVADLWLKLEESKVSFSNAAFLQTKDGVNLEFSRRSTLRSKTTTLAALRGAHDSDLVLRKYDPSFDDQDDDIGTFGIHDGKVGTGILHGKKQASLKEANEIVIAFGGEMGRRFEYFAGAAKLLNDQQCQCLVQHVDAAHDGEPDLKLDMSTDILESLIGEGTVSKLRAIFGQVVTKIKLRRVEAKGECINFHKDVSKKTLQVALTDDQTYTGGRLVFITGRGLEIPRRPVGCATIHDNTIIHGVTVLKSGVRYGLFFLND